MSRLHIIRRPSVTATALEPLPPLWRQLYASRGITQPGELERGFAALPPPETLPGTEVGARLLADAVMAGQRILLVGDFDCDGATSCALGVLALREMGCGWVDYLVPNRFEYGYGLTPEIVEVARKRRPDLLLTVDNGISSHEGVEAANLYDLPVIITDHHQPGRELPAAAALINPRLPGSEGFAGQHLAGVGVLFYLLIALRAVLRQRGWFAQRALAPPNLARYLDLVALGTVADVVPLDQVNRILVHQGLQRMRSGATRPAIRALFQVAQRDLQRATTSDLGFAVGPRLNAAGRLEDMSLGIACLLTEDPQQAAAGAAQLDAINRQRRVIEGEMEVQALAALEGVDDHWPAQLPFGLSIYRAEWHQGVIGILASRIKERYHRPVIAFAPADHGTLKGSGRSVPGVHIRDLLDTIATTHPGMIQRFGGHAMAAGLTLNADAFEVFSEAFDREVRRHLSEDQLHGVLHSDGELEAAALNLELAAALREGGPWGQGFPEPLFDGVFRVVSCRVVGGRHLKMRLLPLAGSVPLEAIAFRQAEQWELTPGSSIRAAYRLDVNEYRQRQSLQLRVESIALAQDVVT